MSVQVCPHGYEVGHCPACKCGPTHHHACACREAAVAKLVEQVEEAEEAMNVLGRHDKDKLTIASYKLRRALAEFHGRKA